MPRDDDWRDYEPDAGASILGAYGLQNPVTLWLLRKAPELLALTPQTLTASEEAPLCPACRQDGHRSRMIFRPQGWACYRHPEPYRLGFDPLAHFERAPAEPVLHRLHEALDIVYRKAPGETKARWHVISLEMPTP